MLIVSPDSQASACPLSGRTSTYRAVRNCGATSGRKDGKAGHRWGKTKGKLSFHGGKVELERPRIRARNGTEMSLPSWEEALSNDLLGKWAMNLMLINVSTRNYGRAVRLPEGGIGAQRFGCVQICGVPPRRQASPRCDRGAAENATVAQALLDNLIERGLDPKVCRLFVIDGAKALSKAVRKTFGRRTPIQRCQVHKARNSMERQEDRGVN